MPVKNEALYATTAQVLPVILVALAAEANFLLRELRWLTQQ